MITFDVTPQIQKLFGKDIVANAFLYNEYVDEKEDGNYLKDSYSECPFEPEKDFNGENLCIEFVNGKKVKIWNSEFGGIEKI